MTRIERSRGLSKTRCLELLWVHRPPPSIDVLDEEASPSVLTISSCSWPPACAGRLELWPRAAMSSSFWRTLAACRRLLLCYGYGRHRKLFVEPMPNIAVDMLSAAEIVTDSAAGTAHRHGRPHARTHAAFLECGGGPVEDHGMLQVPILEYREERGLGRRHHQRRADRRHAAALSRKDLAISH